MDLRKVPKGNSKAFFRYALTLCCFLGLVSGPYFKARYTGSLRSFRLTQRGLPPWKKPSNSSKQSKFIATSTGRRPMVSYVMLGPLANFSVFCAMHSDTNVAYRDNNTPQFDVLNLLASCFVPFLSFSGRFELFS